MKLKNNSLKARFKYLAFIFLIFSALILPLFTHTSKTDSQLHYQNRNITQVEQNGFDFYYDVFVYSAYVNNSNPIRDNITISINGFYNINTSDFDSLFLTFNLYSGDYDTSYIKEFEINNIFVDNTYLYIYLYQENSLIDRIYFSVEDDDGYIYEEQYDSISSEMGFITLSENWFYDLYLYYSEDFVNALNNYITLYELGLNSPTKSMGILANRSIQYGFMDSVNYSFESYGNLPQYKTSYEVIDGGFKLDWTEYMNYASENSVDDVFGLKVYFGGVDISNVDYIYPMAGEYNNYLSYGSTIVLLFDNGLTYSYNGIDNSGLSFIDVQSIYKDYPNALLNEIVYYGINGDYAPYGLSTNTGYFNGYDIGYESGYNGGYNIGYIDGEDAGINTAQDNYYINGYNKGFADGSAYAENPISIGSILEAVVKVPSTIIKEGFDFDILGVNVGGLIQTIIVIALVVFAVGIFKKS